MRAGGGQVEQLVAWAEPFDDPDVGDRVRGRARLSAGAAARRGGRDRRGCAGHAGVAGRVLSTGRSNKNDPNDALSVAIAALRSRGLRHVEAAGHSEVLRLLAKRNTDIGNQRTRLVCRMHALLAELAGGGIAKEINASDVDRFLEAVHPATPVEQARYDSRSSSSTISAASTAS